jgi:zinc protease
MKRAYPLLSLLAALATSTAALAQSQPATPAVTAPVAAPVAVPQAHQFTLSNGLTVIVKPDPRAPTAVNMLWVKVGSMDEVDGTSGIAHMLEHMMFKGTPTLGVGEFSRRVAALGGRENAFTTRDTTAYHQQIPSNKLDDMMRLEADRFAHNQWADEEFLKERQVVTEERRMRIEDNPRSQLGEAMNAAMYTASPYRRPVIGWMSDIAAYTPEDARDFYKRWYVPGNAAVVVAGDVDPAEVKRLAEKHFGAIPARAVPARKPQAEPPQMGLRRIDFKAPAEQAVVALAFQVPGLQSLDPAAPTRATDDEALALTVLAAVLDGYSGARLERALTQGSDRLADGAGASNTLISRGPKVFYLQGVPAAGKTAAQVEAALRAEVARIAKDGVSESELARVKTQWMASEVYKRDSVMGQAQELGSNWVQGFPLDASERTIARLKDVTAAQVQAVAAKYFGDDQLTVGTLLPQPKPASAARRPVATPAGAPGSGPVH